MPNQKQKAGTTGQSRVGQIGDVPVSPPLPPSISGVSDHWVSPYWQIAGYTKEENTPVDLFNPGDRSDFRDSFDCVFRIYVLNMNPTPVQILCVFKDIDGKRVSELTKEAKIPARSTWEYEPIVMGLKALGWASVSTKNHKLIYVGGYIKERNRLPGGYVREGSTAAVVTYPMFFYPVAPEADAIFEH